MKPYVLIVEDEAPLQQLLGYNLERAGFSVGQAYDGDEAQTMIAERTPDLVVLDWMLPFVSGLELCRQLRRRPATAHLPIIMLTARGEEPDRLRGLDTGADDYVTKPFSVDELIARIRAVLRRVRPAFADEVLDLVWGRDQEVELRTVDATIRRLRRALNAGGEEDLLRTVRAAGYAIDRTEQARVGAI